MFVRIHAGIGKVSVGASAEDETTDGRKGVNAVSVNVVGTERIIAVATWKMYLRSSFHGVYQQSLT